MDISMTETIKTYFETKINTQLGMWPAYFSPAQA